jgi:hypothetical protein
MDKVEATVKVLSPSEIYDRNILTMPPRQMRGHLRRKVRKSVSMMDGAFAIVLSTVFDNTKESGVGGKMEAFLR